MVEFRRDCRVCSCVFGSIACTQRFARWIHHSLSGRGSNGMRTEPSCSLSSHNFSHSLSHSFSHYYMLKHILSTTLTESFSLNHPIDQSTLSIHAPYVGICGVVFVPTICRCHGGWLSQVGNDVSGPHPKSTDLFIERRSQEHWHFLATADPPRVSFSFVEPPLLWHVISDQFIPLIYSKWDRLVE